MKHRTNNQLPNNLPQLQNLIKRDPESYKEEFDLRYNHFLALLGVFNITPQDYNEELDRLIMFLAQVGACYTEELKDFSQLLMDMLRKFNTVIDPTLRMSICRALILLRNKGLLASLDMLSLFFELLKSQDKILRTYLQVHIVTDIKNINSKRKDIKVNTGLQNFMFQMLSDNHAVAAKMSLDIMIELYKRNIWKDSKTVNVIATACFSKINKILVAALSFFLGADDPEDDKNSDSEDDEPTLKEVMLVHKVNKKSRKRLKMLKRTKQVLKKSKKKKVEVFDFSAIHLLHDPQGLAEKLLKKLESWNNERYEIKLLVMNFISRLIGVHNLIVLNFYPLLQRFIQPHQREVTKVLMFAAQASHELVPPDVMEPLIKSIANNFITERNSVEVITVGLNSVREICMRCPLSIDQDLIQDLVQYKTYKNKNVVMAARSIIQVFRNINPQVLKKKDRGKPTEATRELKPLNFGEVDAKSYIPGAEVLTTEAPTEDISRTHESDDDSDGWIDVSHADGDLDEFTIDDDDDEDADEMVDGEKLAKQVSGAEKADSGTKVEIVKSKEEKATSVSVGRILSQEEFHKVKVAQLTKKLESAKGKKRKPEIEEELDRKEIVALGDIEKLHKRPRVDKETRLETIMEGREGRENYARRKKKKDEHASKSNKEKRKTKAFMMIKHKVRQKVKRSFKDKQVALRNSLLKKKKRKY